MGVPEADINFPAIQGAGIVAIGTDYGIGLAKAECDSCTGFTSVGVFLYLGAEIMGT